MRPTVLLLATATAVMLALNISGTASIPWWVVILPILAPLLAWLGLSVLAIGLAIAAYLWDRTGTELGRRFPR